ncbi:MAG TPA: peptide ABC transporter substrate-binding protein [Candidatus Limnocylindrales bacterium]|nr:peptide ABC transporter substrate-binding protein [Candidatus Limnocylindrales bacterium]
MRRLVASLFLIAALGSCTQPSIATTDRPVRILTGSPTSLDPAIQGDAQSAAISAQLFESLTTFDADLELRPALAESWQFDNGGRRITFHLRPDLAFSDGTPLGPSDVVRSWLRLIDPARPSPLASLALDIAGAEAYLRGENGDPASVGLHADDVAGNLTVDLVRPASDFPNIVAGPTFGVVPPGVGQDPAALEPGDGFVASGGYVLSGVTDSGLTLTANARYWAGTPAIGTVELIGDLGGRSEVAAFEADELDYTPIGSFDAAWIAYDETLGPQLREVDSLSVQYYGFDTTRAPFDDARVRQAFGQAVDWRRIATLAGSDGSVQVANSMVPPGIPGRSDRDFLPVYDPEGARRLLADAGYPDGHGFPSTTLMTFGGGFDEAILAELKRELGVDLQYETMGDGYFDRLDTEPPQMWSLGWVADYPGRNDFLGVLLASGATSNYGRWQSSEFDAAIAEAGSATDPAAASGAYDRAETIVRDQVPVVPVAYSPDWALSRAELLGASQNGLGIVRMAGLAWSD